MSGGRRRRVALTAVGVVVLGAGLWSVLAAGPQRPEVFGAWERVPEGPLGARESAVVAWTGTEVLVFGGSDAPPCPPTAGCPATSIPPLRDGAAYDPAARSWRSIAPMPVGIDFSPGGVLVGRTVYVLAGGDSSRPGEPRAFLAYSIDEDRWSRLTPPPRRPGSPEYRLLGAGERLVAYDDSGGAHSPGRSRIYDPQTGTWALLPPDPLGGDPGRWMVWAAGRLVAFDCIPQPHDDAVCLVTAAALDPENGRWERLPDSEINYRPGGWQAAGDLAVDPSLGDSNTHRQQQSSPSYDNGGILDPRGGRWSPLPDRPDGDELFGVGVLTARTASYIAERGAVLDLEREEWWLLPDIPVNPDAGSRAVIAAGRRLFVFGGAGYDASGEYVPLRAAWIWSPPPPR